MRPESNDVTLGVTFTPDAPLTRPQTMVVRPLDEVADEVADAAGRRFRLGLALDVTVTPSLPGRLCLPVRQDVRRAAGSRRVHLLHTPNPDGDGMWTSLAAGAPDDPLCAHIPSTSPFAVGYENLGINFAEDAQTLFPFRTGQEVNQPLPGIEMGGASGSHLHAAARAAGVGPPGRAEARHHGGRGRARRYARGHADGPHDGAVQTEGGGWGQEYR